MDLRHRRIDLANLALLRNMRPDEEITEASGTDAQVEEVAAAMAQRGAGRLGTTRSALLQPSAGM